MKKATKAQKVISRILILSAAMSATASIASADSGMSVSSDQDSLYKKIKENSAMSYFGIYAGGSVAHPVDALQPGVNGALDPTQPQRLENFITPSYKLSKDLSVGVVTHSYYYMAGTNPSAGQTGQDLRMLDPALKVSRANLIDTGPLKLTGILTATLPITANDTLGKNKEITGISPTFSADYDIPKTALTLSLYGYVTGYIGTSSTPGTANNYKVYLAPNANYQFTPKFAGTMWVDLVQISHTRDNSGLLAGANNATADIEPGFKYDFSKNFSLNPILNIYPSNPTLASTSVQAVILGKFF